MTLCGTCASIFSGPCRLREPQLHHQDLEALESAVVAGCYICRYIVKEAASLRVRDFPLETSLFPLKDFPGGWLKLTVEGAQCELEARDAGDSEPSNTGSDVDAGEEYDGLLLGFNVLPADCTYQ